MTEKFKILTEFIKDMSSETADVETYLFVKDQISKYHLDIKINSKPLKNIIWKSYNNDETYFGNENEEGSKTNKLNSSNEEYINQSSKKSVSL